MAGCVRSSETRSVRWANGDGLGGRFFICHKGAEHYNGIFEVGRSSCLIGTCYFAESNVVVSEGEMSIFCA